MINGDFSEQRIGGLDGLSDEELEESQQAARKSELASHIRRCFNRNSSDRNTIAERIRECYRTCLCEYEPSELSRLKERGGSTDFLSIIPDKSEKCCGINGTNIPLRKRQSVAN